MYRSYMLLQTWIFYRLFSVIKSETNPCPHFLASMDCLWISFLCPGSLWGKCSTSHITLGKPLGQSGHCYLGTQLSNHVGADWKHLGVTLTCGLSLSQLLAKVCASFFIKKLSYPWHWFSGMSPQAFLTAMVDILNSEFSVCKQGSLRLTHLKNEDRGKYLGW